MTLEIGRLVMTRGVSIFFDEHPKVQTMSWEWLRLHRHGECPYLSHDDNAENLAAIENGDRVLTSWPTGLDGDRSRIWIITEADRSSTCLLFPGEY